MNELLRSLPYGANWKSLVLLSFNTLVAWRFSFHDTYTSHVISICTCIHEWLSKVKANLIYVFSSLFIVKSIDHQIKLFEEMESKSLLLDFSKVCFNIDVWILWLNLLLEYDWLCLANVFSPEQELSIQIAYVNCIKIDYWDVLKPCQWEWFDKLTTNTTRTDNEQLWALNQICSFLVIYCRKLLEFGLILHLK